MAAALLDLPRARWRPALAVGRGHHPGATSVQAPPHAIPGLGTRHVARSGTTGSVGWLFDDPERQATVFDADRIDRLVVRLDGTVSTSGARLLRAKGALRTNQGARLVEWSASHVRSSPLTFTGPGRFELLFEAPTDALETVSSTVAEAVETQLQDALASPSER